MIVVTGGAGFIGSNIVASLNDAGRRDIVVSDLLRSHDKWRNLAKRFVQDIIPPDALMGWLDGRSDIEAIIHMGANSSTFERDGDDVVERNLRCSLRLLDWCTDRQVKFIYASSAATYGGGEAGFDDDMMPAHLDRLRPLNLYGWSKHLFDRIVSDRAARGAAVPPVAIGLKFFNVFGPNEYHKGEMRSLVTKLFEPIRRGEEVALFRSHRPGYRDGEQLRDFVYVEDIAATVLWLLDHGTGSALFNVGAGQARSFLDLIGGVFDVLGLERRIRFVDMPEHLRPGYQYFTKAHLDRLRAVGYTQEFTPLNKALTRFIQHYLVSGDFYR